MWAVLLLAAAAWAQDGKDDPLDRNRFTRLPISLRSRDDRLALLRQAEGSQEKALRSVPYLAALLADEDPALRGGARDVLEGLGEKGWQPLARAGRQSIGSQVDEALGDFLFLRGEAIIPTLVSSMEQAPWSADARALARFGSKALPALMESIRGGEGTRAVQVLAAMGTDARPALDALRAGRGSSWDHGTVAFAIARITPDAAERRRMLVLAIRDPELPTPDEVVAELAREGAAVRDAVPRLKELLTDRPVAFDLMRAIYRIEGDGQAVVPYLVRALTYRSTRDWYRFERVQGCAELLTEMGAAGRPASGAILEQLACEESHALSDALDAVGVDPALVPRLRGWLRSGTPRARWLALQALEAVGPDAAPALPEIVRLLGRSDVGGHAAIWLDRSKLPPDTIAQGLAKGLEGANQDLACAILSRLGKLGEHAKEALPAIRKACHKPGGRAYTAALEACVEIGPAAADAHPEAVAALGSKDGEIRAAGLRAFDAFGEHARAAAPELRALMGEAPSLTGLWAATALMVVAPESKTEVARYGGRCLKEPDLQTGALWMLVDTGDGARPYLDRARGLLKAEDPATRAGAAYLLASRNTSVKQALDVLGGVLRCGNPRAVEDACVAIRRLGPVARPLEGALREVLSHEKDAGRREFMRSALDAIR